MDFRRNVVQKRLRAGPVVAIARIEAVGMLGHPAFLFGLLMVAMAVRPGGLGRRPVCRPHPG